MEESFADVHSQFLHNRNRISFFNRFIYMSEVLFDFLVLIRVNMCRYWGRRIHRRVQWSRKKSDWRSQLFVLSIKVPIILSVVLLSRVWNVREMSDSKVGREKVSWCHLRFTFAQKTRQINAENVDFEEMLSAVKLRKANTKYKWTWLNLSLFFFTETKGQL